MSDKTLKDTNPQVAVMVDMVNGSFDLDDATLRYMKEVRTICAEAAEKLTGVATIGVTLDGGQMNNAIQLLQQVKNKACDAAIIGCETATRKRKAAEQEADAKRPKSSE